MKEAAMIRVMVGAVSAAAIGFSAMLTGCETTKPSTPEIEVPGVLHGGFSGKDVSIGAGHVKSYEVVGPVPTSGVVTTRYFEASVTNYNGDASAPTKAAGDAQAAKMKEAAALIEKGASVLGQAAGTAAAKSAGQ